MADAELLNITIVYNNTNFARSVAIAGRLARAANDKDFTGLGLKQLSESYFRVLEKGIAKAFGATKIPSKSSIGLQPDLFSVKFSGTVEIKESLIRHIAKNGDYSNPRLMRDREVSLGSDINIIKDSKLKLITGYVQDGTDKLQEQGTDKSYDISSAFYNKYVNNLTAFANNIKNPPTDDKYEEAIFKAIRQNILLKAETLSMPFFINEKTAGIATMKFDAKYILNNAKVKIGSVTRNKKQVETIAISFAYPQSKINEMLALVNTQLAASNDINLAFNTKILRNINTRINRLKSSNSADPLTWFAGVLNSLDRSLNTNKKLITADLNYKSGSVIAYDGRLRIVNPKIKKQQSQPSLSIVDISQWVQGRVRLRMARGSGAPRPPRIHERSGTFRSSIRAYANFKTGIINFFYLPYYDSLEQHGYEIYGMVEGSIRAVAQERFNRQFQLKRSLI